MSLNNGTTEYKKKRMSKGFSLIELIVAITIMVIMAGLLTPNVSRFVTKQRADSCIRDRQDVADAYMSLTEDPDITTSQDALKEAIEMAGFSAQEEDGKITGLTGNCKSGGTYSIEYEGERPSKIICSIGEDHSDVLLSGGGTLVASAEKLGGIVKPEEKPIVTPDPVTPPESELHGRVRYIRIDPTSITGKVGTSSEAVTVYATLYGVAEEQVVPAGDITWMNGNTATASVSNNIIKFLNVGQTKITATYDNCNADIDVTVIDDKATGIQIVDENGNQIESMESPKDGSPVQLYANVYYGSSVAQRASVTWSTSSEWLGRVTQSGRVYFPNVDKSKDNFVTITAKIDDHEDSITIKVVEAKTYKNAASLTVEMVSASESPLHLKAVITTTDGEPYEGPIDWTTSHPQYITLQPQADGTCYIRYTATAEMDIYATAQGPNGDVKGSFHTRGNIILYPRVLYGAIGDDPRQIYISTWTNNITELNKESDAVIEIGNPNVAYYSNSTGQIAFVGEGTTTLRVTLKGATSDISVQVKPKYVVTDAEKKALTDLQEVLKLTSKNSVPLGYAKDLRETIEEHMRSTDLQSYTHNDGMTGRSVWTTYLTSHGQNKIFVANGKYYVLKNSNQSYVYSAWDEEGCTTMEQYIEKNIDGFVEIGSKTFNTDKVDKWEANYYHEGDLYITDGKTVEVCGGLNSDGKAWWIQIN